MPRSYIVWLRLWGPLFLHNSSGNTPHLFLSTSPRLWGGALSNLKGLPIQIPPFLGGLYFLNSFFLILWESIMCPNSTHFPVPLYSPLTLVTSPTPQIVFFSKLVKWWASVWLLRMSCTWLCFFLLFSSSLSTSSLFWPFHLQYSSVVTTAVFYYPQCLPRTTLLSLSIMLAIALYLTVIIISFL